MTQEVEQLYRVYEQPGGNYYSRLPLGVAKNFSTTWSKQATNQ
jgi:hypothetical protein